MLELYKTYCKRSTQGLRRILCINSLRYSIRNTFEMLPLQYRSLLHLGAIGLLSVASGVTASAIPAVPFEWQNIKHL